jgi:hypothetical protein
LVPPEADPQKVINKGKYSQENYFAATTSASSQFPDSSLNTLVVITSNPSLPFARISKNIDFQKFPIECSSFETNLK